MTEMAAKRKRGVARSDAPRRLLPAGFRLTGWLLSYLLLVNLILGGVAAGVMAAPMGDGGLLCTTHVDGGQPDGGASDDHAPHCVLCPLSGATPLVPEPAAFTAPLAAPHVAEAPAVTLPAPPAPAVHESARPRAPPVPA
ncbi:DUF2946 family protein [Aquabacter sp. CN5-332]|uniref:DUF2946 domain-containing protein n=1 Tax=Aquabacter sp. CN5-332 TaxID=3156608 RepID=UPI0032B3FC13